MSVLPLHKHTPVDATAASVSVSLPTGAASGDELSCEKYDSSTNTVVITGSIRGVDSSTITLSLYHETVGFRADAAGSWWPTFGHKTLSSLDSHVNDLLAASSTVTSAAATAATAAVSAKALPTMQDLGDDSAYNFAALYGNRELAFGQRKDGSFYPTAKVESDLAALREDTDGSGWRWYLRYPGNREVMIGQRTDGTYYPASITATALKTPSLITGDSLVGNWNAANGALQTALSRTVVNTGIGGQTSYHVSARQGGVPSRATVSGGIIPASGPVNVTLTVRLRSDTTTPQQVVIQGVPGAFLSNDSTNFLTGTFTRNTAGFPVVAPAGSPVQTGFDYRDYNPIFWCGRNNYKQTDGTNHLDYPSQIVADLTGMMKWTNKASNALIFAIPPWVGEEIGSPTRAPLLDTANAAIRDAFPGNFYDLPAMLRNPDIMTAFGFTPTTQDLTDIGNGITPQQLRINNGDGTYDPGHWGPNGYVIANALVAMIYTARGI